MTNWVIGVFHDAKPVAVLTLGGDRKVVLANVVMKLDAEIHPALGLKAEGGG